MMKKLLYILIVLPFLAYGAVDVTVVKEKEVKLNSNANFTQNELIDLSPSLTETEISNDKQKSNYTSEEASAMSKVLKNELLNAYEMPYFISAMNKQMKGDYTNDEKKYMAGLKGNKSADDRAKYNAKRK